MGADTIVMTARASNTRVIVNIIVNLLTAGPHSTLVPRWARLGRGAAGHRHARSGSGRTGMTGKTSALEVGDASRGQLGLFGWTCWAGKSCAPVVRLATTGRLRRDAEICVSI